MANPDKRRRREEQLRLYDEQQEARQSAARKARREHDSLYDDVVTALAGIGIDPDRLKEYLDGL